MNEPMRIQRRRTRGYRMQNHSQSRNGLSAVSICRPGRWGNPFIITTVKFRHIIRHVVHHKDVIVPNYYPVVEVGLLPKEAAPFSYHHDALSHVVNLYERWIQDSIERGQHDIAELTGKNLACFCAIGQPCHGDALLKLANGATQ